MPTNPTLIIEIGDRYVASTDGPECGYAFRAVLKFTHAVPPLPGPKNKSTLYYGPLAPKGHALTEGGRGGQWGTADAVKLLRDIADTLEGGKFASADKTVEGDLLTVMAYELREA